VKKNTLKNCLQNTMTALNCQFNPLHRESLQKNIFYVFLTLKNSDCPLQKVKYNKLYLNCVTLQNKKANNKSIILMSKTKKPIRKKLLFINVDKRFLSNCESFLLKF